jgi:hypothetical protein
MIEIWESISGGVRGIVAVSGAFYGIGDGSVIVKPARGMALCLEPMKNSEICWAPVRLMAVEISTYEPVNACSKYNCINIIKLSRNISSNSNQ